ncbi:hypothetical protein [Sphingobium xenophagum]|uniref:hypothetical protein n=1 Tax=Sphingobium xenophagum TaxID=121428 RepID=UPI00241EE819|nr:hypothetical protein [Sphingobium xenophagum]
MTFAIADDHGMAGKRNEDMHHRLGRRNRHGALPAEEAVIEFDTTDLDALPRTVVLAGSDPQRRATTRGARADRQRNGPRLRVATFQHARAQNHRHLIDIQKLDSRDSGIANAKMREARDYFRLAHGERWKDTGIRRLCRAQQNCHLSRLFARWGGPLCIIAMSKISRAAWR